MQSGVSAARTVDLNAASAPGVSKTPGTDAVVVRNVSKSFGEARALRSCSLTARFGEVHAIIGENGSGKSTLAKILAGVFPVDAGTAEVANGHPSTPREARELGVAVVFQEVLVAEGSTVLDNLFLGDDGLFRARHSSREKKEQAQELLDHLVGAPVDLDGLIDDLPLNTRQWIVIARALLSHPRIVIFDESTAALDHSSVERFFDVVRQLRADGVCVLIVTHRIRELIAICDRATVLSDGVDVGTLSGPEITEARLLELMRGEARPPAIPPRRRNGQAAGEKVLLVSQLRLRNDAVPIDLEVGAGEIIGLAGLEGHGQVEFIQAITGFRESVSGSVTVVKDGRRHAINSAAAADRASMVYIPGDRKAEGLFANLSVFENFGIALYRPTARAGMIDWGRMTRTFGEQTSSLSVRMGSADAPINSLSGGNQQKIVVGRALATEPLVLALNDPTRGVDIGAKYDLYNLLHGLAGSGKTVLFLSNEIEEFLGLCDRVVVFRSHSLFRTLVGDEITSDAILAAMFGYAGKELPDAEH
jgi:ribose transport system ATP-binding protein